MGSDDFSHYLDRIPGCYFLLNYLNETGYVPIHSQNYVFNDKIISLGALIYAKVLEKRLCVSLL